MNLEIASLFQIRRFTRLNRPVYTCEMRWSKIGPCAKIIKKLQKPHHS